MERTKDQTKEWITATRKGDISWFDRFYQDNKGPFVKWALGSYHLSEEDLKDVYQQAAVVFYENLVDGKLDNLTSSIKTYLFGIGKNLLLKKLNKRDIEFRHMEKLTEHWLFQGYKFPDYASAISKVEDELNEMKEPCRSILEMYYLRNLDMETITEKLGYRTSDVVKTQKSRCLKSLRTKLNEWWNIQNK